MGAPKGSPKSGGRQKGVPNKVTADVRAAFRKTAEEVAPELKRIALKAENEATRVAAIKEIFDRAFGKASQPVDGDGEGGPVRFEVAWLPVDA